jgi:hypothetical protein
MKTKQRLAYSYEANGVRRNILVVEDRKFGWNVTIIENGVEVSKRTGVMGSMMTVMAEAISG